MKTVIPSLFLLSIFHDDIALVKLFDRLNILELGNMGNIGRKTQNEDKQNKQNTTQKSKQIWAGIQNDGHHRILRLVVYGI